MMQKAAKHQAPKSLEKNIHIQRRKQLNKTMWNTAEQPEKVTNPKTNTKKSMTTKCS